MPVDSVLSWFVLTIASFYGLARFAMWAISRNDKKNRADSYNRGYEGW